MEILCFIAGMVLGAIIAAEHYRGIEDLNDKHIKKVKKIFDDLNKETNYRSGK